VTLPTRTYSVHPLPGGALMVSQTLVKDISCRAPKLIKWSTHILAAKKKSVDDVNRGLYHRHGVINSEPQKTFSLRARGGAGKDTCRTLSPLPFGAPALYPEECGGKGKSTGRFNLRAGGRFSIAPKSEPRSIWRDHKACPGVKSSLNGRGVWGWCGGGCGRGPRENRDDEA